MWKLASLVLVSALVVACAAGTQGFDLETAQRAHVQLELSAQPADEAVVVKRHVIAPKLPRVDRIAQRVRFELGDSATARLELCVKPDGGVARVALLESSQLAAFDQALLRDTEEWQFAALPGPSTMTSCRAVKIEYGDW